MARPFKEVGGLSPLLATLLAVAMAGACSDQSEELAAIRRSAGPHVDAVDAGGVAPAPLPTTNAAPASPRSVPPTVVDLGTVATSVPIAVDIPPNAIGFQIVAERPGASAVGIKRVVSPSGEVALDEYKLPNGTAAITVTIAGSRDIMAAAAIPQADVAAGFPVAPGKWLVTFGGDPNDSQPIHASARIQLTADGQFHGAELDLNVFVPDGLMIGTPEWEVHPVTAATAAQDPSVMVRIDRYFALVKQILGVDRGKLSFFPAPASARDITTQDALNDAFAASTGQPDGQALNLTLTNTLEVNGVKAWGIAPGIPGVSVRSGTSLSGIVLRVTNEVMEGAVDGDAITILHEGGHFMGLQHTTEFDGSSDPLSDTPICPTISSTGDNSGCPDFQNMMFASGEYNAFPVASNGQKRILYGAPVFHALLTGNVASTAPPTTTPPTTGAQRALRLTRSGRALGPMERWLTGTFCGLNHLDVQALIRSHGVDATRRELAAIAVDPDVPEILRHNAGTLLHRIP
jgi:hypothetical protein